MKTKLSVGSLAEKIARDNEKFAKARPATKRVIVAKDCLSRIKIGQIGAVTGHFCSVDYGSLEDFDGFNGRGETSIKDVLNSTPDNLMVCEGCAKGSLLMSYLGRVNEFTFDDLQNGNDSRDKSHEKLLQLFSKEQLTLIETFFEGTQCIFHGEVKIDRDAVDAYRKEFFNRPENIKLSDNPEMAVDYDDYEFDYDDYSNGIEGKILMIEICKNIIANKGTFVLPEIKTK